MGLSEDEIVVRLAELRRRREALDREIADHLLYLELGRRLRADTADAGPVPDPDAGPAGFDSAGGTPPEAGGTAGLDGQRDRPRPWTAPAARPALPPGRPPPEPPAAALPDPVPFDQDPVAARRYGRALVAGALAVLADAGRPMHAGELLERLVARGFTVPGRDPVAALNTRLWKRAGPGGPLRRLGDAVYDRADAPEESGSAPEHEA